MRFKSSFDVRKAKAFAGNLKDTSIFLRGDCSVEDRMKEKALLNFRYELVQKGVDKTTLRIRGLNLYFKTVCLDTTRSVDEVFCDLANPNS